MTAILRTQSALLRWYLKNARDFPWRETRDPYVILISEIMLQQTQTDRVAQKLPAFLKRFPTVEKLARANRSSVIKAWQGMGYNRRAVHLHNAAKSVVRSGGTFPDTLQELRALPGVGQYTASAILCFAFGKRVPVVDVNIRRVLSRISCRRESLSDLLSHHDAWVSCDLWLPRKNFYEWNQALMDIGAQFCKAKTVKCGECPLKALCPSTNLMIIRGETKHSAPGTRAARSVEETSLRTEPMRNGVPNRIWRGKIVEALRKKSFASVQKLGTAIDVHFSANDKEWITTQLKNLERDGLVRKIGNRISLAR